MNESEALNKMVAPGTRRPGKYREGVIQIHVTRACDKSCYGCTQGSNLNGRNHFISLPHFESAVLSLRGYFGVVGVFGGNPALHPHFEDLCEILRRHVPFGQRGLWCNHPVTPTRARVMRETFDPSVSNLNVHLDRDAYTMFKTHWPECNPVGLDRDSRHSPPLVALKDLLRKECECLSGNVPMGHGPCKRCNSSGQVYDEEQGWELISRCDINQHWSAMIGVFRGELRAWFCEVAGAQSILYQDDLDYPDTGLDPAKEYERETVLGERLETTTGKWWQLGMAHYVHQVRRHCHDCGIPLRGYGELAQAADGKEQVSETHCRRAIPKRKGRRVELVTVRAQLDEGKISKATHYLQNSSK